MVYAHPHLAGKSYAYLVRQLNEFIIDTKLMQDSGYDSIVAQNEFIMKQITEELDARIDAFEDDEVEVSA